jgi:hypothetical protein
MKLALLSLSLMAVVAGTASASLFVAPSERPPRLAPTERAAANVVPSTKLAEARPPAPARVEIKRPPVPLLRASPKPFLPPPGAAEIPVEEPKVAAADSRGLDEAAARAAIQADGYKGVRNLAFGNGRWSARALRGSTEIGISVGADGSVSAN